MRLRNVGSNRRLLVAAVGLALVGAFSARAAEESRESQMRRDITFLASDECEGRGVNTKGINLAADYIAREFQKAGLKPAGADGGYFQPFGMAGPAVLESPNTLELIGPLGQHVQLRSGEDFRPVGLSKAGQVEAPVVFAGYGATAPDIGYDDYKDVDVAGKVILVLRKTPRPDDTAAPFDGDRAARHAALQTKLAKADVNKAAAVLFVNDVATARQGDPLMEFAYTAGAGGPATLPAVHVRRAVVDDMLRASLATSLRRVEGDIDRTLKPHSALLKGWTVRLQVSVRHPTLAVKNVIGVVEGAGRLAKETVVVGAHYDHLGYGGPGSLARNLKQPAIHHGADDNASGSTALMELARRFGHRPAADRRRLVFIAFSGEESGLLGSEYYCKHPVFPLEDTTAMVNLDMVGRLRTVEEHGQTLNRLILEGTGTGKDFGALVDSLNEKYGFKLQKVAGGMGPSDQASFYARKIPVLFFFTGDHPDYHKPSDTADKINVPGMRRVTDFAEDLIVKLAESPDRPEYVKVASGQGRSPGFNGPRLGIRPSYGDEGEGVLLSGVSEGGPAAKAGLKEGDRIVEIGGKPVKNLEGYMALLQNHKKGEALPLGVLRDGQRISVTVTPE